MPFTTEYSTGVATRSTGCSVARSLVIGTSINPLVSLADLSLSPKAKVTTVENNELRYLDNNNNVPEDHTPSVSIMLISSLSLVILATSEPLRVKNSVSIPSKAMLSSSARNVMKGSGLTGVIRNSELINVTSVEKCR